MVESKRETDFTGLFLILVLLFLAAIYLRSTQWTGKLDLVFIALFFGFGAGILLGKSKFDRTSIFWFTVTFSLIFVVLVISLIFDNSIPILNKIFLFLLQVGNSFFEYTSGKTVTSPLFILITFTMLFWFMSLLGTIAYIRHRIYFPLIVITILSLVLIEYFLQEGEKNHWITGFAVLISFLIYLHNISYQLSLTSENTEKPSREKFQWTFQPAFLIIIALIVAIAWSIPLAIRAASPGTPEAQRFNRFSYQMRDNFYRITASLRGSSRTASIGFGPNLPLGTSAADGESVVFTATTSGEIPNNQRIYWRSKVYESYDDATWQEGEQKQLLLEPGTEFIQPIGRPGEIIATYRVKASLPLGDYYFPGELISINNPANFIYSLQDDGGRDIIAVEPENTILPGNSYRMQVLIRPVDEADLIGNIIEIPAWINKRYLQVPESIFPKVQDLAQRITLGKTNNYEKTVAVTNYLRANFEYQEELDEPESTQDRIEWFLFEGKKGYCNYYASAEVILLRSLGIPARLVVGFSEGEVSEDGLIFTVKEKHRHAWPEVFFPEIGWVVFEPTPSQPETNFFQSASLLLTTRERISPEAPLDPEVDRNQGEFPSEDNLIAPESDAITAGQIQDDYDIFPIFLLVIAIFIFTPLLFFISSSRKNKTHVLKRIQDVFLNLGIKVPGTLDKAVLHYRTPEIEFVYNDTVRLGILLFRIKPGNKTPKELLSEIIFKCPVVRTEAEKILLEYQKTVFGEKIPDDELARKLGEKIQLSMIKYKFSFWFKLNNRQGNGE